MTINLNRSLTTLPVLVLLGGCAAVAPSLLVDARADYVASSNGLAAKLTPTELYDGKKVLDKANREFEAHGDTPTVRDYAYVAKRKFELADVKARTEADRRLIAAAVAAGVAARDAQVKEGQQQLAQSREELKDERSANRAATTELRAENSAQGAALQQSADQLNGARAANSVANAELQQSQTRLSAETQARVAVEAKLAGAMKDLASIAAIKEERRGLVITLSGSVLFASGEYALLETAKTKLDQVAVALMEQGADKKMVVEGHTDSLGSDATNQPLSLNRATAVRDYLVGRGVDSNRISAVGMGSSHPIVDNRNAENRADNRRVEIVIQPLRTSSRQ
jgi:outer membrane protein OmpA-like peptidoglycan-associated protein